MSRIYCIHPAIGIARLGDSPDDYFIGPEAPGMPPVLSKPDRPAATEGKHRDAQMRIKRQGARFRIYEYERDNSGALTVMREITASEAQIEWQVHLANRKAASLAFNSDKRRNEGVPENKLVIDAGAQKISGIAQGMQRLQGTFMDRAVALGDMLTDSAGRLIVLGGFGKSESVPAGLKLASYSNNDGWHDDIADGPVRATLRLNGAAQTIAADPAWLLVAPPDFAPEIQNIITLYDIVYNMMAGFDASLAVNDATRVSFTRDVYPILHRVSNMYWLSNHATAHVPGRRGHFLSRLSELASNAPENLSARQGVFRRLRNPSGSNDKLANMPKLPNSVVDEMIVGATLTEVQYARMAQWAKGKFEADWTGQAPTAVPLDQLPIHDRPQALDRAALESAVGAGRFPGIEAGQIMLDPNTYDPQRPFRINDKLLPGTLTARMAVPWQADFRDCEFEAGGFDWWPGQRPNHVYRDDGTDEQHPWRPDSPEWEVNENVDPPVLIGRETMVAKWAGLGFVVRKEIAGAEKFVEDERLL